MTAQDGLAHPAARPATGGTPTRTFAYDAFMSYSHTADRPLAPEFQRLLRRVGRPWFARGVLRIFRDQTNLPMSEGLWSAIEAALADSRHFVLMASPLAAQSPWVQREVAYWRAHRARSDFFVVQTDGCVVWDGAAADFDWTLTDSLPRAQISGWFPAEPRWLDVRQSGPVVRRGQRNDKLRDAARTVAARLYGVDKDQLEGEDERESRRARRTLRGGIAALVLVTVAAVVAAFLAVGNAAEARTQLRTATARALAAESDNLAARDPVLSARLAVTAASLDSVPQATAAMMRSVERNRYVRGYLEQAGDFRDPGDALGADDTGGNADLSPSGHVVAVADQYSGEIRLWDTRTRDFLGRLPSDHGGDGSVAPLLDFAGEERLVATFFTQIDVWDLATRTRVRVVPLAPATSVAAISVDGTRVALIESGDEERAYMLNLAVADSWPEPVAAGPGSGAAAVAAVSGDNSVDVLFPDLPGNFSDMSGDGSTAVVLRDYGTIELWDLRTRTLRAQRAIPGDPGWLAVGMSDDGSLAVVGNDLGELLAFSDGLSRVEPVAQLPAAVVDVEMAPRAGEVTVAVDVTGNVVALDPTRDSRFTRLSAAVGRVGPGGESEQPDLVASDNGRWLAVEGPSSVQLWNVPERRLYGEYPVGDLPSEPSVAFDTAGTRVALVRDTGLEVRELPSLAALAAEPVPNDPLERAHALQRHLGGIRIVSTRDATTSAVLAVGPSGEQVLAAVPADATDRTIATVASTSAVAVAWTTDALAGGPTSQLITWTLTGAAPVEVGRTIVPELTDVQAVSDDGRSVVLGDGVLDITSGRTVPFAGGDRLFATATGVLVDRGELLVRHLGPTRYATAAIRNSLPVWDVRLGLLLGEWQDPLPMSAPGAQSIVTVRVTGGIATVRPDGSVAVWTIARDEWSARLCQLVGEMTPAERAAYLPDVDAGPACSQ